ncbi:MAG: tetratricopeptide (TPR) repeat protein [Verrucomicrobiales bacterium]
MLWGLLLTLGKGQQALSQGHVSLYFKANESRKAGRMREALDGFQEALDGAKAAKDVRWTFYSAYRVGFVLRDMGEGEKAVKYLAQSFETGVDSGSGDIVRVLSHQRNDAVLVGISLTKPLADQGLLTEAIQSQERINLLTNHWVRSTTGKVFDCLVETPPQNLQGRPLAYTWRMRTSQADLWDLHGRTLEAAALLRKILADSEASRSGSEEDREWQRTRLNLGVMLVFLGHRKEALTVYKTLMNQSKAGRNAAYARFNWARLSSREDGPSQDWLAEARSALKKMGGGEQELERFGRTLASMETELGEADVAEAAWKS